VRWWTLSTAFLTNSGNCRTSSGDFVGFRAEKIDVYDAMLLCCRMIELEAFSDRCCRSDKKVAPIASNRSIAVSRLFMRSVVALMVVCSSSNLSRSQTTNDTVSPLPGFASMQVVVSARATRSVCMFSMYFRTMVVVLSFDSPSDLASDVGTFNKSILS